MAINRGAIAGRYPSLVEGMTVYSNDGERMGKVTSLGDDYFLVEKGIFFPKDFTFRYDDIQDGTNPEITNTRMATPREGLRAFSERSPGCISSVTETSRTPSP